MACNGTSGEKIVRTVACIDAVFCILSGKQQTCWSNNYLHNNFELKLYYSFLSYIHPIVNYMNVEFQSENVRIHAYLSTVEEGLTNIMGNFIKKTSLPLPDSGKSCFDVVESDESNLWKPTEMFFGVKFDQIVIQTLEYKDRGLEKGAIKKSWYSPNNLPASLPRTLSPNKTAD